MSQKSPPRSRDHYIIRSENKKAPHINFHITEIIKASGYTMKDTALCGEVGSGSAHNYMNLNGVTCHACQDVAMALGII